MKIRIKRALNVALLAGCTLAATACADNLSGPGEDACIFAYSVKPPGVVDIPVGDSLAVTAFRNAGCGGAWPVAWTVDNATIATVRPTGDSTAVVRGTGAGVTSVNVRNGNHSGFMVVRVN